MHDSTKSQEQRILLLLHASWPNWTPATALSRISLQYNARIFSLRRRGWQIANRVEVQPDGTEHCSFRLATPGTYPNPSPLVEAAPAPAESPSLFGDISPDRYLD